MPKGVRSQNDTGAFPWDYRAELKRQWDRKRYQQKKKNPHYVQKWREKARRHYHQHKNDPWYKERSRRNHHLSDNPRPYIHWNLGSGSERGKMWYMVVLKKRRSDLKAKFFEMYGGVCSCCGEGNLRFLTLDHVKNDGKIERKAQGDNSLRAYQNAVKTFDDTKYQVLCYNCNLGKAHNGGVCPHKESTRKSEGGREMNRDAKTP